MYLGYQDGKIKFYTEQPLDKAFYNLDKVEETELEYVLDGDEYVLKDEEYEARQAQKERERIGNLKLTRGDVFRALFLAKQITRDDIRALIKNNELISDAQRELALIDFDEALNFYRGNTLIDTLGLALGITSEQLDRFFETNDYKVLLPPVVEEPQEVENDNTENATIES